MKAKIIKIIRNQNSIFGFMVQGSQNNKFFLRNDFGENFSIFTDKGKFLGECPKTRIFPKRIRNEKSFLIPGVDYN